MLLNKYKIVFVGLLMCLSIAGCQFYNNNSKSIDPPNIVWITAEDIGPGLGCYGDESAITPNLDQLAEEGIVYEKAYANAPICAPARSSLITGLYPTSMGTQHLRSRIPLPDEIKTIPEYLQKAGYYCTNNYKTDYNFDASGRWDDHSKEAHWRNGPEGKPFFSVFNFFTTHEGPTNSSNSTILETLEFRHDPDDMKLPPYFPNTGEFRKIWARQYDLISVMDQQAGDIIQQLKDDGLYDNTIIFFFGDHGYGLPGYKRWLTNAGLKVPLIIRVPEKYKSLVPKKESDRTDRLVSFEDFAPTVLNLAGVEIPNIMEGQSFLGKDIPSPENYVYGSRSRADDVYDVSRSILDERYIYIRHFMPHLPYVQNAIIFSNRKRSYAELIRLREKDSLHGYASHFYQPKPLEELYDLKNDPYELNNLANHPDFQEIKSELSNELRRWIISIHDTGMLHEAEMMLRSKNSTPYNMAQKETYNVQEIYAVADNVGNLDITEEKYEEMLGHESSGVRYWSMIAMMNDHDNAQKLQEKIEERLKDPSPSVALAASEVMCKLDQAEKAIPVIKKFLQMKSEPWVVLQAAMVSRRIGGQAEPLLPTIQQEFEHYQGNVWGRYKNGLYPMFIGLAFDQTRMNCGIVIPEYQ